jgi:hypothetical protein
LVLEEQIFNTEKCPKQNLEQRKTSTGNSATRINMERPPKELKEINREKLKMRRGSHITLQEHKDSNISSANIRRICRTR